MILAQPVGFTLLSAVFSLTTTLIIFFLLTNEFTRRETAPGWIEPAGDMVVLRPTRAGLIADIFAKFGMQKGRIRAVSKTSFLPGELQSPFAYETSVYRVTVRLNEQTVGMARKPHSCPA